MFVSNYLNQYHEISFQSHTHTHMQQVSPSLSLSQRSGWELVVIQFLPVCCKTAHTCTQTIILKHTHKESIWLGKMGGGGGNCGIGSWKDE